MTTTLTPKIKRWLLEHQAGIKAELAMVEITPHQFAHFDGDLEYAEVEIIEQLQGTGTWDGDSDYDEITTHPTFRKSMRWQAAYNTIV